MSDDDKGPESEYMGDVPKTQEGMDDLHSVPEGHSAILGDGSGHIRFMANLTVNHRLSAEDIDPLLGGFMVACQLDKEFPQAMVDLWEKHGDDFIARMQSFPGKRH